MKNFTKQNFKTNPLWIRLLIMTFMLLAGAGNAWAAWYLKGEFNSWNTNNVLTGSGNDLTTTVELKKGTTYAFKVHDGGDNWYGNNETITSDCTWTFSTNAGDGHITASTDGVYTFTFNTSTKNLTVVYPKPTYLLGTLTDWTNGSELPCSINLQANTAYEFKIKQGDTWYGNGGTMTADNSKGWTFGSDNGSNCHIQTSLAGDYYFSLLWEGNIPSISVSYPCDVENSTEIRIECISTSGCPNLHAWTSSNESITGVWPGKAMYREGNTNIYYYEIERATYKGSTVNIIFNGNNEPQTADIKELEWGKVHRYTRGGVLVYSDCLHEDCTTAEFSVNSLSDLAVGCTTTASITGDNVTVTWSSSETSVASIDPNTGVITAEAAGETTITATTTDADGFCAGVVKETTLTVKSPSVLVEANKTSLCAGEELILTATVTNAGTGNTYQWYKGDNSISGATSATYTINSVSTDDAETYNVAVSGGILCQAKESAGVTVTVNPIPSAPTFTTNSAQVCSGVAFNLNEKFPRNSGEAGTLTWYKTSDDSQVTNPESVTITESTSYYAKATNNNCTSGKSFDCTVNVDANPTLELESTPTVCPNVEIDLNSYVDPSTLGTVTWYSDTDRKNVITGGLVTPIEQTTYYASSTNGVCDPEKGELVVNVYGIPDEMPAYTSIPATSCKGTPNSNGSIALKNTIGYITYTLDGKEGDSNVWTGLSVGTHKLAATINTCPSITKEWDVEVEVEDITPDATVSITGDDSFCEGGNTILTSVVTATQGEVTAYQWYNGDNPIQGATESTYTAKAAGSYKVVVTVENKGCEDTFNATKEVSVKNKPTTPEFTPDFTSICVGGSTTLASGYSWYTDLNASALANLTVSPQTETTYYAIKEENGCTSDAGTFTVKVNPLPRINIEKTEPTTVYKYADVKLKANGDNISTVGWSADKGTITKQPNHPDESDRAMLTYDQKGAVTVTATATSEAGCTATSSAFQVKFTEEDCSGTTSTDLIITCNPNGYYGDVYLHIWPNGESSLKEWPGYQGKWVDDAWKWEIPASSLSTSKQYDILFHNNKGAQTKDLDHNLVPGNQYNYTLNHTDWGNGNNRPTMAKVNPIPLSTPPTKVNPTVKTVSVTSNEDGVVTLNGMVVATGCNDQAKLGLQYKKQNQDGTWPDAYSTVELNTKEDISKGKTYTTTVTLEDGTYKVRACAHADGDLKGYGYDVIITVSTVKTPITTVTLTHVKDQQGTPYTAQELQNLTYCVGDEVWFKLEQDGSDFKDYKWVSYPGTSLKGMYSGGTFKFTITGSGFVAIKLRNDANVDNEGNATWVESNLLEFKTHPEPTAPYISINPASGVLCEGNTATITVTNPSTDCAYKLVDESLEAEFVEYESGDLKYSVGSVGKYYVAAKHIDCPTNEYTSNQVEINQIISTSASISIDPANPETTPWEPVTITVNPQEGYVYELSYTGNNLAGVDGVIIKQNGDSYTYYIPRPDSWGTGDSNSRTTIGYRIKATLKVEGEATQCQMSETTATITLEDEDNENCEP